MNYVALDTKPKCRLYRVTSKRRIPAHLPFFVNGQDTVSWWSDGRRTPVFLKVIERTERMARNVPKQSYIKVKETREHWYEVTR